jgi:hypothetical protein
MLIRLIILFLLCFVPFANAEQKYIWTDENGQTNVSETEPENWETQEYENSNESEQTEILKAREEAASEDQSKTAEKRQKTVTIKKRTG